MLLFVYVTLHVYMVMVSIHKLEAPVHASKKIINHFQDFIDWKLNWLHGVDAPEYGKSQLNLCTFSLVKILI